MLIFGLHCHQPVDNFGWVVEEAVGKCYRPLFELLYKYPRFRFAVHFSGWLIDYLKKHHKDIFDNLKTMAKRGQIEFLSGGFYEPILEAIPEDDRIYQIKRMNNYIKTNFSQTPNGLWLTERVYSEKIVKSIALAGIDYIVIDDTLIDRFAYTSVDGYTLKLLPISRQLRYAIPFKDVDTVEILLKSNDVNIIFDDCEKFGVWPGTFDWVYKKKWLERFLDKGFETQLPKEFVKTNEPVRVSLPDHSYPEMGEWSLDLDGYFEYMKIKQILEDEYNYTRFLRGGVWRNFLNKYYEANWIQKRLWYLSKNKLNKRRYMELLTKGQCNDVLWHGIFGGLYLPNLRDNAYRYIIQCENMLNKKGIEKLDIDLDLRDEFLVRAKEFIAAFNSNGEMVEFDDRKQLFNFQNTLRRYKERYHFSQKETKKFDTIHHLSFDFSKYPIGFDDYWRFSFLTENDQYSAKYSGNKLVFTGNKIKKTYRFSDSCIDFAVDGTSQVTFNFHFAESYKTQKEGKSFSITDNFTNRNIVIQFSDDFEFEEKDVVTYSIKESGVDAIKQGIEFSFVFKHDHIKGSLCLR